ncbi:MAG: SDR family NAD(P)-dependent oxidoreductase [Myxococcales bacterium]|jgi:NAD(P)-dependent dehydrogenase (short-subunit alcohol dehydrogenase family)|nr:SDR family oxidoreductase [Sphingomicrobium sp.]
MSLEGKVVVISGAGTGMGADAARAMRAAGASLVLNGRRANKLEQVASSIDPGGNYVACVTGDIGDPTTSALVVTTAVERFGGIHVLFNNAGIFEPKPFLEVSQDDLSGYFNLMGGYFGLTQNAVRQMKKQGGGAIISIGSIWAMQGIAATPSSAPSMAKGGIHSLTRALAIELAPDRIRVNAIAPGVVETPLFDPLLTSDQLASFNAFHPLGRNGQPHDITSALLFLADDTASGWITGVVLPVDGGVMAGRNAQ